MLRRDFLKASAVGAGVTLLEGCGGEREVFIEQVANRPGVLQGESVWLPSVCGQCAAGCGILVRVVDGDAKKIEGDPDHPVNRGGVCALGHSALQELYNPDRLLSPRRRTGAPGDGAFEELTWEQALQQAVDAIGGVSAEGIAIVGSERHGFTAALLRRFADALGAAPPAFVESPEHEVERRAAFLALGVDDVPYFDMLTSDYVLTIGAGMLDRWRSPVHYTGVVAEMRRGLPGRRTPLVSADARMTLTSANADEWLPIRPGTEGTFARALAGFLLDAGAGDEQGRAAYARLFPDPAPALTDAAGACGVPVDRIRGVAEALARAEWPVVLAGGSAAAHSNGVYNVCAGLGLNVLLGRLGRAGGVWAPDGFGLSDAIEPPSPATTPVGHVVDRLRGDAGPPVELLLVSEADLLHALPGGWGLGGALDGAGTVVTLSSFANDTTVQSDLVLPILTELERFNVVEPSVSVVSGSASFAQPVVAALGEGHHPADVVLALAAALGEPVAGRFPWQSFAALARETLEAAAPGLPGGTEVTPSAFYFAALERGGFHGVEAPTSVPYGPTGAAPAATSATLDGDESSFPFVLLPFESLRVGEGRGANRPWLQEMPDPMSTVMWNGWIEVSVEDAESLGLRDGDRVRVESVSGSIETHVVVDPAVRPGLVAMPLGHGHRGYGRYAEGRGANPMALVGSTLVDGTRAPARSSSRVRLTRVGPGELVRFGADWVADEEHAP